MAKQFKFNTDKLLLKNNKAVAIEDQVANLDLTNLSETGRKSFFPSNTFITINLTTNSERKCFDYIAPANGWVSCVGNTNGSNFIYTNFELRTTNDSENYTAYSQNKMSNTGGWASVAHACIPVRKNDNVNFIAFTKNLTTEKNDINGINQIHCRFYYAEGEV